MPEQTNVETLRATYERLGCPGIVALIDFLSSPQGKAVIEIGSSSIGLNEIMDNPSLTEEEKLTAAWLQTRSLYIGSPRDSITPLQWLAKLALIFGHVPSSKRASFDTFCSDLAWMVQHAEDVTVTSL